MSPMLYEPGCVVIASVIAMKCKHHMVHPYQAVAAHGSVGSGKHAHLHRWELLTCGCCLEEPRVTQQFQSAMTHTLTPASQCRRAEKAGTSVSELWTQAITHSAA